MNFTPKTLLKIKSLYSTFSPKQRKIADFICHNPDYVLDKTVHEIALTCGCDDAQLVRFCQTAGFEGIRGLRAALALEFMPTMQKDDAARTPFEALRSHLSAECVCSINDTANMLSETTLNEILAQIRKARHIAILGFGSSGLAAQDLKIKLFRMGFPVTSESDPELSKLNCGTLEPGDLLFAISYSGENKEICEMARYLQDRKVKTIAITNYPESTLGQLAAWVLQSCANEPIIRIGAMSSLIAQLMINDLIAVGLSASDPSLEIQANLLKSHQIMHLDSTNTTRTRKKTHITSK